MRLKLGEPLPVPRWDDVFPPAVRFAAGLLSPDGRSVVTNELEDVRG